MYNTETIRIRLHRISVQSAEFNSLQVGRGGFAVGFFFFFVVSETAPRASHFLHQPFTTELYPQSTKLAIALNWNGLQFSGTHRVTDIVFSFPGDQTRALNILSINPAHVIIVKEPNHVP